MGGLAQILHHLITALDNMGDFIDHLSDVFNMH